MRHEDRDADLENLDSIIKRCEEAMGKSFKKPDPERSEEMEEGEAEMGEEGEEESEHSEADIDELLRMYSELKDRK